MIPVVDPEIVQDCQLSGIPVADTRTPEQGRPPSADPPRRSHLDADRPVDAVRDAIVAGLCVVLALVTACPAGAEMLGDIPIGVAPTDPPPGPGTLEPPPRGDPQVPVVAGPLRAAEPRAGPERLPGVLVFKFATISALGATSALWWASWLR